MGAKRRSIDDGWAGISSVHVGTIDDAIAWIGENIDDEIHSPEEVFDEQDHWDGSFKQVVENSCRYCSHSAGCQEAIRREVMFDA